MQEIILTPIQGSVHSSFLVNLDDQFKSNNYYMVSIVRANEDHSQLLSAIATQSFIESHGHSAKVEDINSYIAEKHNEEVLKKELQDPANIYHILYHNDQPAGYSRSS